MSGRERYAEKTYRDVEGYLAEVRQCVRQGDFKIAERGDDKNRSFTRDFNIISQRTGAMICSLSPEDFLHVVESRMEGNEDEELWVFCKRHALYSLMSRRSEDVLVYYKFDLIRNISNRMLIVVSMHVAERPPEYVFQ